ncbi:hypothetical protein [Neorhizobium alkalisoli]|uniref:Uncharacterized protein n=1 Tax=Neorhizobium alkalisoli TaxID=528178 RepID=A0A561Q7G5_9HYPH|nr:hypothetical protein [Neorhizobium alkalisoli]TWF46316.1 hypothetical protein FHW37_11511 [Neorhizobium alkalisoli]
MEDEATIPNEGTALDTNSAADLISQLDIFDDSDTEQTEEHVEEPVAEEVTETPEEQFFDIDGEQISLTDLRSRISETAGLHA